MKASEETLLIEEIAAAVQSHLDVKTDLASAASEALTENLKLREKLDTCRSVLAEIMYDPTDHVWLTKIRNTLEETNP